MKKINVYVVTYNNEQRINENIARFFDTTKHIDTSQYQIKYHVINNHSNLKIHLHKDKITVFYNPLRLDRSCGHLSRDYNMCLMHGFQDLKDPQVDQITFAHDDSLWLEGWFEGLQNIHQTYTFYSGDHGCSLTSFLPEAVRNIGMWDERFCNIGFHEADYLLRAKIYNGDKSSINDFSVKRIWNHRPEILFAWPPRNAEKHQHSIESEKYHHVTHAVFDMKWGIYPEEWHTRLTKEEDWPKKSKIPNFVFYPYFEKDIYDLAGKGYVGY